MHLKRFAPGPAFLLDLSGSAQTPRPRDRPVSTKVRDFEYAAPPHAACSAGVRARKRSPAAMCAPRPAPLGEGQNPPQGAAGGAGRAAAARASCAVPPGAALSGSTARGFDRSTHKTGRGGRAGRQAAGSGGPRGGGGAADWDQPGRRPALGRCGVTPRNPRRRPRTPRNALPGRRPHLAPPRPPGAAAAPRFKPTRRDQAASISSSACGGWETGSRR